MHLFKITIVNGKLNSNSKGKIVYVKRFFSSEGLSESVERTFTLQEQKSKDTFKMPEVAWEGAYTVFHNLVLEGSGQFFRKHTAGNCSCLAENVPARIRKDL